MIIPTSEKKNQSIFLLNKSAFIDISDKFMIKNSNFSVFSIYMVLWAHMQHIHYATLVHTEFSFRANLAEELSESHMAGLSSEILLDTGLLSGLSKYRQ